MLPGVAYPLTDYRKKARAAIFPGGYPTAVPSVVSANYAGTSIKQSNPELCSNVRLLRADLPFANWQVIHECAPVAAPSGRAVIVEPGHSDHYYALAEAFIQQALARGDTVFGLGGMPNMGFNDGASSGGEIHGSNQYRLSDGSTTTLTDHTFTAIDADPAGVSSLRFFLEATIQLLNYIAANFSFTWVDITGISGGCFVAELIAMLDARIRKMIGVFGSVPKQFRASFGGPGNDGDYEQAYTRAWWSTLIKHEYVYAAGSQDAGRKFVKVLSFKSPPCDPVFPCYTIPDAIALMERYVASLAPAGKFSIHHDVTATDHVYSAETVAFILSEFAAP